MPARGAPRKRRNLQVVGSKKQVPARGAPPKKKKSPSRGVEKLRSGQECPPKKKKSSSRGVEKAGAVKKRPPKKKKSPSRGGEKASAVKNHPPKQKKSQSRGAKKQVRVRNALEAFQSARPPAPQQPTRTAAARFASPQTAGNACSKAEQIPIYMRNIYKIPHIDRIFKSPQDIDELPPSWYCICVRGG